MALFDAGGPQFGLDDAKIAVWNGDGTYGTAVDVPSVQMMDVQYQTVNGQLEGDDIITDTHAKARSAQVRIRFGSVSFPVLAVLTGVPTVSSPGARTQRFGKINFPYFGLCGRALSTRDGGDTHLFVPQCKIMEGFTVSFQYGQYAIPEITCMAVYDTTFQDIYRSVEHDVAQAVTVPPVFTV